MHLPYPQFSIARRLLMALWVCASFGVPSVVQAQAPGPRIGIVVMHGKGGSPTRHVSELASALTAQGALVANLDMPWSKRREYDATVAEAEKEVEAAINDLRTKGAQKIFIAGHSQGGLFALYFGSRHAVDGIVAIAPGGDPSGQTPREKLASAVQAARKLVAEGKGDEKTTLADYEGAKGTTPVNTAPSIYLTWFDPDQAPNTLASAKALSPTVAVLHIAPSNDYPALARVKKQIFDSLPPNPLTQLYEPNASHLGAPDASVAKILEWTRTVANAP
jgi:predicted alpha/beta-hydrolase family hydrolase